MIIRSVAGMAIALLVFSTAPAASGESLASAILACSAQQDAKTQLDCYNGIAAQLKGAPAAQASDAVAPAAPAPESHAARDFGSETMAVPAGAPAQPDQLTARVADVTYNSLHIFKVTLDNGQVWRQLDSDDRVARFRNNKTEIVTISRGFMDSFHLVIQGSWGEYAVKRVK